MRQPLLAILELLCYQFDFNFNNVGNIILQIYKMCDFRQILKKLVCGCEAQTQPVKNVFDALSDSFILIGQIKNPIRNYTFGFMTCVNKRIYYRMEWSCSWSVFLWRC